jgi:hypothetical protein
MSSRYEINLAISRWRNMPASKDLWVRRMRKEEGIHSTLTFALPKS